HARKPGPFEIMVRLDERVGHNTQGFLPIVQPHFGGLWQSVRLITVPENAVDDLRAFNPPTRKVEVRGDQLRLDGKPLIVRGVLNWGYYPPTLEPNPPEGVWREDRKLIKASGYNL